MPATRRLQRCRRPMRGARAHAPSLGGALARTGDLSRDRSEEAAALSTPAVSGIGPGYAAAQIGAASHAEAAGAPASCPPAAWPGCRKERARCRRRARILSRRAREARLVGHWRRHHRPELTPGPSKQPVPSKCRLSAVRGIARREQRASKAKDQTRPGMSSIVPTVEGLQIQQSQPLQLIRTPRNTPTTCHRTRAY